MSGLPFDLNSLAPQERPSTEALNRGWAADRATLDFFYRQLFSKRASDTSDRATLSSGFYGDGFKIRPVSPAAMQVEVSAGLGFLYDPTDPLVIATDTIVGPYQGVSDISPYRPLVLPDPVLLSVPAPPGVGQSRYDVIEVRAKRELSEYGQLLRFDTASLSWQPRSAAAFLRYASTQTEVGQTTTPVPGTAPVNYLVGTPAATGTQLEPPASPGYVKVGRILVTNGATSIGANLIVDQRPIDTLGGDAVITAELEVDTTQPGQVLPTLLSYSSPPGINATFVGGDSSVGGAFTVVVTGGVFKNIIANVQAVPASTIPDLRIVSAEVRKFYTDPAEVNSLIAAAMVSVFTANPLAVGIGTPFKRFYVFSVVQKNGTTYYPDNAPAPEGPVNVIRYFVTIHLQT